MLTLPLIRTDDDSTLTPIERTAVGCEQVITALLMAATVSDPRLNDQERETLTTMSVATIVPAEA
tara:strand:+ start:848 stop:1042 length:195 start_codon:yes stop_codon:yes gene_type:complete